ncbi:MAG TPA: hypothetical protein VNT20_01620 [Flavisolibacter sp.]|jgi:hypothetical protein|nr:hypothetical protein [Flavisolibacter sp.]
MEKVVFEKNFDECLNRNFETYSKYFDFEYKVFHEFRPTVFQIAKCLILEMNYTAITLTNHLLERLLKLALISKAVGVSPIPTENWNSVFEPPVKKYGSMLLGNTIEQCKKENLIDDKEKSVLFDVVRELMRNGFSHADAEKILSDLPDEVQLFEGSFSNPNNLKPVSLNPKLIPPLQSIHMESFAKANATNYFDYIFRLIGKIEDRLISLETIRKI